MKSLIAIMLAASCSMAVAEERPRDPYVGKIYAGNHGGSVIKNLGTFWDKEDCEFVTKGEYENKYLDSLMNHPYEQSTGKIMALLLVHWECEKVK